MLIDFEQKDPHSNFNTLLEKKRRRLTNNRAVWNWWWTYLYVGFFLLNMHHLNDSIYNWNCYNQAQFFKQRNNHELSHDWNFCMEFFATWHCALYYTFTAESSHYLALSQWLLTKVLLEAVRSQTMFFSFIISDSNFTFVFIIFSRFNKHLTVQFEMLK